MSENTVCPTCKGVGLDLQAGVLVDCADCHGEGRVPAVWDAPFLGVFGGVETFGPWELLAVPKEFRG